MDPLKHHVVTFDNCGTVSVFLQVDNTRIQSMGNSQIVFEGRLREAEGWSSVPDCPRCWIILQLLGGLGYGHLHGGDREEVL